MAAVGIVKVERRVGPGGEKRGKGNAGATHHRLKDVKRETRGVQKGTWSLLVKEEREDD